MRLGDVIAGVDAAFAGVEVCSLAYDNRRVRRGSLFFCVTGRSREGHDFARAAVQAGASALVVERPLGLGVPEVRVASARAAMGPAAAAFNGHPSRQLAMVGVTGTNGKTTTAFLVRALMAARGLQCGLLGTVKSVIGGVEHEVVRTTPEAIDLQADLRAMVQGGDRACAMEVSSHALELGRAEGIDFAAAIFTNLTQDHLDFHPTMEDYFQAKRRLFVPGTGTGDDPRPRVSVVNAGDPYGRRLAAELAGAITFAVGEGEAPAEAGAGPTGVDYLASGVQMDFAGCRFTLHTPAGPREVVLPLPGRFNVANAVGAIAAVHQLGGDLDTLVGALAEGVHVPGRFEPVDEGQEFAVLVDYAHTPDSLENVLRAARALTRGRVLCVFGAGGDRDRAKRPLMGEIAAAGAEVVVVTSDNPRSEEPAAIVAEVMAGAQREGLPRPPGAVAVEALVDRREALARAFELAQPGDVVVMAGKGHEQGQEFAGGHKIPFDDVTVARETLRARAGAPA